MHLRSRSRLGLDRAPSRAPTQGSQTQSRSAQEEQEIEALYSSSSSKSDSMSESGDMYDQRGQHTKLDLHEWILPQVSNLIST